MRLAKNRKVFIYTSTIPTILFHVFLSYTDATKHFTYSKWSISQHINSEKVFNDKWILHSSPISEEPPISEKQVKISLFLENSIY